MRITLPIKPLSINEAFCGRHFKTDICRAYESALRQMLPTKPLDGKYYAIDLSFFLKNFELTDGDNLVKVLQDMIIKSGIITDDRRLVNWVINKYPADKDLIIINIKNVERPLFVKTSCFKLPERISRISHNYEAVKKNIAAVEKFRKTQRERSRNSSKGLVFYVPKK